MRKTALEKDQKGMGMTTWKERKGKGQGMEKRIESQSMSVDG